MDHRRYFQLICVAGLVCMFLPSSCAEDSADPSQDSGLGGQAGAGGAGGTDAAPDSPFAHCIRRPPAGKCGRDSLCAELECGKAWSMLDDEGCERAECERDLDCTDDERCLPSLLVHFGCQGSFVEDCNGTAALCFCSITADCRGFLRCVPKTLAPKTADCLYSSSDCNELSYQVSELQGLGLGPLGAEVKQSVDACITRLQAQMQQHGC